MMHCSGRKQGKPSKHWWSRDGLMPYESFIQTKPSIPFGIILGMRTVAMQDYESTIFYLVRMLINACLLPVLTAMYGDGKKQVTTPRCGSSWLINSNELF